MLGYEVTLKQWAKIKELCYETPDGQLGLDGIAYNRELLKSNNFKTSKVVGTTRYGDNNNDVAVLVENTIGQRTYIHFNWIEYINDEKILNKTLTPDTVGYNKITNSYAIEPCTMELLPIEELPMCSCGKVGKTKMYDGKWLCSECLEELTKKNNYSYKPDYKYIGKQLPNDIDNPVWYGLEVEVAVDKGTLTPFVYKHKDSLYLKDDSSIRGSGYKVEIVSHPHSFNSLMSKDSWLEDISKLSIDENDNNGCHVHISRSAFKDDKHYSLFYFLLHKMEKIATKVGGRALTDYCRMTPSGRVFNKKNTRTEGNGRSLFLNEQNTYTVEARFFKGTVDTSRLKAYIQFLESMIKYTKYHSKSVTVNGWFRYTKKKSKKYSELIDILGSLDGVEELNNKVVYKEPKIIKKKFKELTYNDYSSIDSLSTSSNTFNNVSIYTLGVKENEIYIKYIDSRGREDNITLYINNIVEVTLLIEE